MLSELFGWQLGHIGQRDGTLSPGLVFLLRR
jgi:hypothetical protein